MRGAVAQLGERLNGIQEVRGSIPLSSTNSSLTDHDFASIPAAGLHYSIIDVSVQNPE